MCNKIFQLIIRMQCYESMHMQHDDRNEKVKYEDAEEREREGEMIECMFGYWYCPLHISFVKVLTFMWSGSIIIDKCSKRVVPVYWIIKRAEPRLTEENTWQYTSNTIIIIKMCTTLNSTVIAKPSVLNSYMNARCQKIGISCTMSMYEMLLIHTQTNVQTNDSTSE